ncbi:hypothetical protein N9V96_02085 [Polaribacter sp.]|nr:hypothetical protein [Polaribacter sp.]
MKKIITVIAIGLMTLSATAQNKKKGASNECYLTEAASTFDLSEDKKNELNILLIEVNKERASIKRSARTEEITKEEAKTKSRAINRKYAGDFAKLAGKSKKEVNTFIKEVRGKCNKKN